MICTVQAQDQAPGGAHLQVSQAGETTGTTTREGGNSTPACRNRDPFVPHETPEVAKQAIGDCGTRPPLWYIWPRQMRHARRLRYMGQRTSVYLDDGLQAAARPLASPSPGSSARPRRT